MNQIVLTAKDKENPNKAELSEILEKLDGQVIDEFHGVVLIEYENNIVIEPTDWTTHPLVKYKVPETF